MSHLIELKDIYKIYHMGEETVHALDGINLTVDQGEFVAIVGSSGSGKSTAMNIIGCLDVPTSGTYHLGGIDVSTMEDDQQAEIKRIVRLQDGRIIYDGDASDPQAVVQPQEDAGEGEPA